MPNFQDIERFKQDILALGRESELLELWGETYEDVPPPEQGLSADLSELVGAPEKESTLPAGYEGAESGEAAGEDPGDLASFLDNLSLEPLPGMEEPESTLGSDLEAPEAFSFPEEAASVDALGKPIPPFEGLDEIPGVPGLTDEIPEEGAVPEALLQGLSGDLETWEPESPGIAEAGPEFGIPEDESAASSEEIPGLVEDLSDFEIPEIPEMTEPSGEAPADQEIALSPEEFSLFGEPEPGAGGPPAEGTEETAAPAGEGEKGLDYGESAPDAGADSGGFGDAFDTFRLDEANLTPAEVPPGAPGSPSLDEKLASLENDLTPADNFNLESAWGGADFSIPGWETPAPAARKAAAGAKPEPRDRVEGPAREPGKEGEDESAPEVALSEEQVDALQDTLLAYPLNLRLAVEEALAEERGTEVQRARLVHLLVRGATPGEAASLASRILKRPVTVPRDFEKRTGAEIEAEKSSLPYILVHTVAPVAAMVLAVVLGLGTLGFLGYRYVYRPIRSELLYRQGYEEIRQDRFPEAEAAFDKADRVWVHKRWYYRYAEAFAAKNQFVSAARRYDGLLERWPNDRRGVLDYSAMEFKSRLDYPKAAKLLKGFVEARNYYDKDALLLLGDVYLEWAESEEDRGERLFEDARLQYSTLVERYGPEDPYMERMLRWFLRTDRALGWDNSDEIRRLKDQFMAKAKSRVSSETLADLGAYLLDRGELDDVSRILLRAVDQDASVPEAHYELSRYFRRIGNGEEERTALTNAVRLLEAVENPSNRRLGMLVAALNRRGEGFAEKKEYVTAEDLYTKAIQRYERALSLGKLRRSAVYGKAYANLGDILFFQRDDLDGASALYKKAQDHGYVTPETLFKQGYVDYRKERWETALENFYRAGLDSEESPYLLYSTGNALFQREDYFAAQGYYSRLVERLQFELEQLPLVEPQVRPSHGEIVDLLMRATNNLGVSLYRIGNRMGDARRRAGAMAQFMESSRYYDSLERDPGTMIRPESKNLGYLNLDFVLHPQRGIDLSIFPDLPKTIQFPKN